MIMAQMISSECTYLYINEYFLYIEVICCSKFTYYTDELHFRKEGNVLFIELSLSMNNYCYGFVFIVMV